MKKATLLWVSCGILIAIFLGYQYWDYDVNNTVEMKSDPYGVFTVCHPTDDPNKSTQTLDEHITWTRDYCLTWNDFTGEPDYEKDKVAWTAWWIQTYSTVNVINETSREYQFSEIDVVAFFNKTESWVIPEQLGTRSLEVLRHEQGHFDLAE